MTSKGKGGRRPMRPAVPVSELGERWVVGRIQELLSDKGVGDDCAYLPWGKDYLLATTDVITISTHLPWPSPRAWGWHAAAVNLSDVASKGGEPLGVLLSLLLPPGTPAGTVLEMMRGAKECCARYGTRVIGGDTKEGPEIALAGTALGRVPRRQFMPRSGARPGDILGLTGELGTAAAGFLMLREGLAGRRPSERAGGKAASMAGGGRPAARGRRTGGATGLRGPVSRLLLPLPRVAEGRAAAATCRVHASTDLSDGLSASVHQLCIASGVGAELLWDSLPVSSSLRRLGMATEDWVLHFGGEYELLMAVPPAAWDRVQRAVARTKTAFTPVGRVLRGRNVSLSGTGWARPLRYGGWEHFRKKG